MKYLILKIIGILGLIITPILLDGLYDVAMEIDSYYSRRTWHEGCIILLVLFLVITLAGFARSIAKIKAWIDFHTDFDDDQELDGYPKVKVFSFVKKIAAIVLVVAIIVVSIMSGSVDFVANNYGTIMFALVGVLFALFLASIIVCLIMRIVPLYYDIAVVLTMIGLAINFSFAYYGIAHIYAMMASVPLYAIAALCISTVFDEFISIDEFFDWICDDKYDEYYKELCEREKAKNAKQELSVHKQAKQKKIENKPAVRQEKKQKKEEKKETKKTQKQEKKTNKTTKKETEQEEKKES